MELQQSPRTYEVAYKRHCKRKQQSVTCRSLRPATMGQTAFFRDFPVAQTPINKSNLSRKLQVGGAGAPGIESTTPIYRLQWRKTRNIQFGGA